MNGIRKGDEGIFIGKIAQYKKPVLMIGNRYVFQKVASFDNEEQAEKFSQLLNDWFDLKIDKES